MTPERPDPDKLLKNLQEEEARRSRARLKIFFGAAPGVGKTYSMLLEAQKLLMEGVEVVGGVVEVHGRAETAALTAGIEFLPKRTLPYRGVFLEEFDLEAALKRKPKLILMDELAHSNVQGSLHAKRWQDVWDLLDAGIDVFTTVNVQHLESLRDVVAGITGITMRETIPDTILQRADEIELVDIPVEELQQRLQDGKVYVPEQARHAIDRYFRKGNLLALRELALRRTAELVDADMRRYMSSKGINRTWAAGERFLVCVGPTRSSANLIRATKRMAETLGAPWIAVYVETIRHWRFSERERAQVEENLQLSDRLGAETVVIQGDLSLAEDLVALAQSRNVTRIVVGKNPRPRWLEFFTGSLVNNLVRRSGAIQVHIISSEDKPEKESSEAAEHRAPLPKEPRFRYSWAHFLWSASVVVVWTAIAGLLNKRLGFELADTAMLYTLAILIVAARLGLWPSMLASLMSVLAFDFFFVPPQYTFAVKDYRHMGTFAVMFAVGLVIGNLTERLRAQTKLARTREQRTLALLKLSGDLARSAGSAPLVESAIRNVADQFQAKVAIFLPDEHGRLKTTTPESGALFRQDELAVAQWAFDHHEAAGLGTDTLPGAKALHLPLMGAKGVMGVMGIMPEGVPRWAEPDQRFLLEAFANQTALAVERVSLTEQSLAAQRQVDREQLRNALLSSVSHDLRTPLSGITGAASALLEEDAQLPPEAKRELLGTIHEDAQQLQRLVTNLLDLTKLESGALTLKKEWTPMEEVVGSALNRMEPFLKGREFRVELASGLPLVPMDPVLMEQVVCNLVENAHKYSPLDLPVEVKAWATEHLFTLCVADKGPGIPEGEEERIFEKLVRLDRGERKPGAGLGLAICKGIVQAHGGWIQASNRPAGGAQFLVGLPLEGAAPSVPLEDADG